MRRFLSYLICVSLLLSVSFFNTVFAAEVYESESNNTFSTANTLAVGNIVNGQISSITDSDMYKIQLSSSLSANISLTNIPGGCDYDVYLYDSTGNKIGSSINSSNADEKISIALYTGTYYINVFSYSGSSSSYYKLSVTGGSSATPTPTPAASTPTPTPNSTPTPPPYHGGDMYEFNDAFSLATNLGTGNFSISEANIHPLGDVDYFEFNVSQNVSAYIVLNNPAIDLSYHFSVYNSNYGYLTSDGGTGECTLNLAAGTYYIKVYSYSTESVLSYRLRMTTTAL